MPLAGLKRLCFGCDSSIRPDLKGSGPLSGDPDSAQAIQRWQTGERRKECRGFGWRGDSRSVVG